MYLVKRNKIYHVYYVDEHGKKRTFSTKCTNKSDAQKRASEILSTETEIHSENTEITFKQFRDLYRQYTKSRFTETYQKLVASAFTQLARIINESMVLSDINPTMIESFINLKKAEGKGAIINGYLRALQGSFERAVEMGYLKENIIRKVKKLKLPENEPIFLKEGEFEKIIEAEPDTQFKFIYTFAINTGMRRDEIRLLKWDSIDFENNLVLVKNHNEFTTKSKRSRTIPLSQHIINELKRILEFSNNSEYIFIRDNKTITKNYITDRFRKAVVTAKLNNEIHFHTLRHTFASRLVQKGISLYIVSKLLGHADIKTTQIYSHLRTDDLRDAIDILNNF